MGGPEQAVEVYEQAGVAALFIFLYVGTMGLFIWTLMKYRKEDLETKEKLAQIIERNTSERQKGNELLDKLCNRVEADDRRVSDLLTYLKARDDARRYGDD